MRDRGSKAFAFLGYRDGRIQAYTRPMKTLAHRQALLAIALLAGMAAFQIGTASATGTARILQRDGSQKTYTDVRIVVRDQAMWITSSDGRGTLVFGKAACTKVDALLECLPYDATLYQNGENAAYSVTNRNRLDQSDKDKPAADALLNPSAPTRRPARGRNEGGDLRDAYRRH